MTDQPVPSVTGNREWEWNSRYADAESSRARRETAKRPSTYRAENERLRRRVERLETELDRRERRLRHIVEQYERLLAARNRQLEEASADGTDDTLAEIRRRFDC